MIVERSRFSLAVSIATFASASAASPRVDARTAFFEHFGGDEIAELTVARVFAARLIERRATLLRGCLGLTQGERVARLIDSEQHLALLDLLVVHDLDRRNQSRHVGGDLDHVGAYVPVAGPRREQVVVDEFPQHECRDHHDDQGQQDLTDGEPGFFHVISLCETTTTRPSTST
ncbi:hypothetical protein OKW49_000722 [Paraburkholderia youngii]